MSVDSERTALMIQCIECENDNWFAGTRFNMMCRYSESDFNCQDCGRTLETGDDVTHSDETERTDPFEHSVEESQMMDDDAAEYVNEWGW